MKRYIITNGLRKEIKNSSYSITRLCELGRFNVKNIYYKNISINEDHLKKLNKILNLNIKPKEIKFDYIKNLGKYAFSPSIKSVHKSRKLAEFIGIMLGDGNIYMDRIDISFDKRNQKYIEYVETLCKKLFNIKLKRKCSKKTNQAHLYYYNKKLTEKLLKLGLKRGNKIKNQLGIPYWIKENKTYSKGCIGGLIDTDGCIYLCKREKQKYIKFTNFNQQLLNDFKEVTKNLGYSFAKANKRNACLYRKVEVVNFINEVTPFKAIGVVRQLGL